jgi:hypothetical protein
MPNRAKLGSAFYNSSTWKVKAEFEHSLRYIVRLYLKPNKVKQNKAKHLPSILSSF